METLILLVPTDLKSFLLGVCSGAIVLFATGFLQKAGEHSFEWIKRKFMSAPCAITDHDKELFRAFIGLTQKKLSEYIEFLLDLVRCSFRNHLVNDHETYST